VSSVEQDFWAELAQIQAEFIGWIPMNEGVASMKRGAPYFDLWALATKADLNEEELLSLAKNHFTPR
jgi:hypothetical protein